MENIFHVAVGRASSPGEGVWRRFAALIAVCALWLSPLSALAGQRIALVIGNGAYGEIGALRNPVADGALVAEKLTALGFETRLLTDSNQMEMKRAVADFGRSLRAAGRDAVGLFYYAGHGIQADGRNFLMPVEAAPADQADLDLMGIDANWVLRQMESAGNTTNVLILDACRNNPLAATSRSVNRGLARITAPTGSFISYATAPGMTADDGDLGNSPFTLALVEALDEPGKPIEQVFKEVRINVVKATEGRQTPWDSSSLVEDFYFTEKTSKPATSPVELSLWQSVSQSGDPGRLALFLQIFPESQFAEAARELLGSAIAEDPAILMSTTGSGTVEPAETETVIAAVEAGVEPAAAKPEAARSAAAPRPSEHEMIARAQSSRAKADYEAYLAAYPNGVFADLAQAEVGHLSSDGAPAASTEQTEVAALSFERPLTEGSGLVKGRSLHELARSEPEFPPVAGLPKAYWVGKKCSNCHNWSPANLCDQGKFYTGQDLDALGRIKHPFGGSFKAGLRDWAEAGCL